MRHRAPIPPRPQHLRFDRSLIRRQPPVPKIVKAAIVWAKILDADGRLVVAAPFTEGSFEEAAFFAARLSRGGGAAYLLSERTGRMIPFRDGQPAALDQCGGPQ